MSLLVRLDRPDAAIDVAAEHLAGLPESALVCPGVAQLCQRTGDAQRLAAIARDHGDLVNYTAALLMTPRGMIEDRSLGTGRGSRKRPTPPVRPSGCDRLGFLAGVSTSRQRHGLMFQSLFR